jgi:hypothetical protein
MASIKVKIRPINQLLRRLPTTRLDPAARTTTLIEIIARGFTKNFELDSTEFQILSGAVRMMLNEAWTLNRVFVDHQLDSSRNRPSGIVPEWSASERGREIREARERLENEATCHEDIEHGMNVVVTAFQSMHTEFRYALMPDTNFLPPLQRYRCAALIPPTVRLLERKWLPVLAESANSK